MRSNYRIAVAATFTVAALTVTNSAHAQTFYNNLTDFQNAVPNTTLYEFEGIAPFTTAVNPPVLVNAAPGNVTFSATGGSSTAILALRRTLAGGAFSLNGTDSVSGGNAATNAPIVTTIQLGGFYTGFSVLHGIRAGNTMTFSFALFNGNTQVGVSSSATTVENAFFGVTHTTAFDRVRATASIPNSIGASALYDSVRVGTFVGSAVAPEPGTLVFVVLGAVGFIARRRKANVV